VTSHSDELVFQYLESCRAKAHLIPQPSLA
jgi:hypothetical protein